MNKAILLATACSTLMFSSIAAQATAITDVSEISGYTQIYQLDIPDAVDYNGGAVPYGVDNSGSYTGGSYERIGYYLELQKTGAQESEWIWVSMNAFSQDLTKIAIPRNDTFWQQIVENMTVESNVGSIVTGTGIETGNIEFWNNCYSTNPGNGNIPTGSNYDFNDARGGSNCYGSFQIHNWGEGQTLLAYNAFESDNQEVGIGNNPNGHPDWTFANNAGLYEVKNLEIWVGSAPVPEPAPLALLGLGLLGLGLARKRRG